VVDTSSRVARYVDPTHGTGEDALFIPTGGGELFCVVHHPPEKARGSVIICPSIFAEEHKIYGGRVRRAAVPLPGDRPQQRRSG
jgi:hypothetical protein